MNLYVHFPFCRRKCSYCALYSRAGSTQAERDDYAAQLACELAFPSSAYPFPDRFSTVYFGGGSPALCDLGPVLSVLSRRLTDETEFTVELHPEDVTEPLLATLKAGGVNRISMGVQSLDDRILELMRRGYTADQARRAFDTVRKTFDNAGVDLIVGYPGDRCDRFGELSEWGIGHCSVYSLQNERNLADVPDDGWVLDRIAKVAGFLKSIGLERYEISNYAAPGRECRHNLAVWRGEDYLGLGEGAHGRIGLVRTLGLRGWKLREESVTADFDRRERTLFRLRTREGLDPFGFPEWIPILRRFVAEGLLYEADGTYCLTPRGYEVCDTVLAELV